jgi:hypothetical protein
MASEKTSISLYENSIPPFVESELVSLYAHIYASLAQFMVYNGIGNTTHTYVAQKNGKTSAALVFRLDGRTARVLNEQIWIDAEEIERFTKYVFNTFPAIDVISFGALRTDMARMPFPYQRFYRTEDIVITLPPTPDAYLANLGKATRKNIKKHSNRFNRSFPSLAYQVYLDDEISEQHVRDIIALNRARMVQKNKASDIDEDETVRMLRLVKQCGLVCLMTIDGQVCAGSICTRVGDNYFNHISAHHPDYDAYRLGTLCCYLTICEAIERGAAEFHFMWGRFEYKYALLGVKKDFDELIIYRSWAHFLRHAGSAARIAFEGYRRTLKFWLLDIADQPDEASMPSRLASRFLNWMRDMKQSRFRLATHRH